jgi:hypothetical protein
MMLAPSDWLHLKNKIGTSLIHCLSFVYVPFTERLFLYVSDSVRPDFHDADDTPALRSMLQTFPSSLAPAPASTLYDPQLATPRPQSSDPSQQQHSHMMTTSAVAGVGPMPPRPPSSAGVTSRRDGVRPGSSRGVRPLSASSAGRAAMLARHQQQVVAINAAATMALTGTPQPPFFMMASNYGGSANGNGETHSGVGVATTRLVRPSSARPAATTRSFNIGNIPSFPYHPNGFYTYLINVNE